LLTNQSNKTLDQIVHPLRGTSVADTIGFATILNRLRRTRFAARRVPRSARLAAKRGCSIVV